MVYLRGEVKFLTGGIECILSAREPKGRIWCDSKADSIVWMGEGGGSATFQKLVYWTSIRCTFNECSPQAECLGIFHYKGIRIAELLFLRWISKRREENEKIQCESFSWNRNVE
jgi:hypothetical protein